MSRCPHKRLLCTGVDTAHTAAGINNALRTGIYGCFNKYAVIITMCVNNIGTRQRCVVFTGKNGIYRMAFADCGFKIHPAPGNCAKLPVRHCLKRLYLKRARFGGIPCCHNNIVHYNKHAFAVNDFMVKYLKTLNLDLVDFKIEFGRLSDGTIVLADEISPDTCRLWDCDTKEKLDKDRFRRDMGGEEDAYKEVMRRLMGEVPED